MKKVVFDTSPLGSFQFSCEAYEIYYKEKFNQNIFFYTRHNGKYIKVEDKLQLRELSNRVIVKNDLGSEVDEIPHNKDMRVAPLTEELESDDTLIQIVERLGDKASWKHSKIKVVELVDEI